MNTGQMLLSLGALLLLSTMILRFNRSVLTSDEVMYNSKFNVLASSLCTSIIEEARGKAFDESTVNNAVTKTDELSKNLGSETGETYETFDDFDDFNGYVRVDSTMPSAVFYVMSKVDYIVVSSLVKPVSSPTWHKRITVTVISPSMKDPVQMSSTFSYWYFR